MNRNTKFKGLTIAAVLLLTSGALAMADTPVLLSTLPSSPLSADEEAGILFMREEEKLARDVYLALDEMWDIRVFANIASSEQQHMDSMLALIDRYNLEDPALSPGLFTNPELQSLYDALVDQGSESAEAALAVGALIEEVDIEDLLNDIAASDNEDIRTVYESLTRASENHLRAFVSQLERFADGYEPQVLDQDAFDEIVGDTDSAERGPARGATGTGRRI